MIAPSRSAVTGALVGGAIGDAMGAPFEGLWADSIPAPESLERGFHEYEGYPYGQYTDDTQLTLATVASIVNDRQISVQDIAGNIAELWRHHSVIGPGGACTEAAERFLATGDYRHMGAPEGQAGNGTAMRTAAIGLWFGQDHQSLVSTVADISRLTHRDSRSVAGGVVVAMAANLAAHEGEDFKPDVFCEYLADSCRMINAEMADLLIKLPPLIGADAAHTFIADAGKALPEFDRPIITPFVIPTVLASVYCVLTHPHSWIDAVTCAIRLGGDVDTLGAIVGAIAGARDGVESMPSHLVRDVQDSHYIQALAAKYHSVITSRLVR